MCPSLEGASKVYKRTRRSARASMADSWDHKAEDSRGGLFSAAGDACWRCWRLAVVVVDAGREIDQAARPSLTKRGKSNDRKRKQVQREAPQLLSARPDSARPLVSGRLFSAAAAAAGDVVVVAGRFSLLFACYFEVDVEAPSGD
ncbi:hypothetical protein H110_05163 [Trichophyton rubrum MR1448]|nr:hypothetical protein H110_05163 [Trichophyton rubrum MR1448]